MRSIRAKIMWVLFISVSISSLIIGALGIALTSNIISHSSNQNMNLLCKTNADELDIVFAKVEDSVATLAHYAESELPSVDALKDKAFRTSYTAALKKSALHHIESTEGATAVYMHYDEMCIGELDGFFFAKDAKTNRFTQRELTAVGSYDETGGEHSGWWHFSAEQHEGEWLEADYNVKMQRYIISYVVPIYKDNTLIGIIGADISTEHIENIVKQISVLHSGKAAVLKDDGTVMYHPNFDRGTIIGQGDPGFDGVVEKLSNKDRTTELIPYELDGVEKRIASCKLRNGMLMVCFAPVAEIYREQNILTVVTILITLVVVLGALLLAFFVSRDLARPIKKLNEAAKHLTEGEFDFDIDSSTRDEIGELTHTFIETREIIKHQIRLLDTEAHRDGLTGVGNKSAFMDREEEINTAISAGTAAFSVAVFDVNKLKITNDVFGHMAGDKLLATVANHLAACFGDAAIYRTGGDEFVVILTGGQDDQYNARLQACVLGMRNLTVDGYPEIRVSCAYGVSAYIPDEDHQLSDVLRRADKEMYNNKAITKKETFPWQEGAKGIKQLQVERYCELLQTLTVSTDDYLFLMNTETGVIRFFGQDNSAFDIADGRELSNGIADMLAFVHPNDHALIKQSVSAVVHHEVEVIDINFRMHNNDVMRWVNCRGSIIKDETDSHFVVIGRISQNAVKHLYNPLTTLFNKTKLKNDLQKQDADTFSCLMLLDIDNLSEINLKHGSAYGDALLLLLAEELERRFSMQQIYHAEKDRFVVLLDVSSSSEAEQIFNSIKSALANKCSVSASVVPNDRSLYVSIENIYDYAVQILNQSKKGSIGQIVFFSRESMLERISAVELLEELEESVKNGCSGFRLVYQPQVDAEDCSLISAEALLRFDSTIKGQVYPDRFIPVLEQTGLINEVGIWVINEALTQCKKWRKHIPDFRISVNVSPKQLERKRLAAQVVELLKKHRLPGEALILEITESAQLDENENVLAILEKLRKSGVRIAIDDFGTGYSNLGHLKHIHANILKVDRIFIQDIRENGYNYNLIHNIIEFAKANELKVCLEGVETTAELVVLSALGPHILQGYLFDRPSAPEEIERKYFLPDTAEYAARAEAIERLSNEKRHAPVVNMETKTILRGINVGLWIIRIDQHTGEGELYTDDTMRRLLGVDDKVTAKECYRLWYDNIVADHRAAVDSMVATMAAGDKVTQVEYVWRHPLKGDTTVRCTGRCTEKTDKVMVFEGFHRIISDLGKSF